jgi:peptide/nickel transport system substrate-binding protein
MKEERMNTRRFKAVSIVMALVLITALLAGCGATAVPTKPEVPATAVVQPTQPPAQKPTIVMALDSDLDNLEPTFFKTDSAYYLVSNVYQSLLKEIYKPSADGKALVGTNTFEPDGAESFTYSADGTCVTFKIRPNQKFTNGAAVTAASFKYGIDRALLGPGYLAGLLALGGVTDASQITLKDDMTLEVCAPKKTPMFEPLFAFSVIPAMDEATSKQNATTDDPWGTTWYKTNVMGSGPYILKEWKPGEQYVVEPNPDFWRGADYYQNSQIIVKLIPNPQDRELLLKSGGIDLTIGIPYKDVDTLKTDPNVNILEIPYSRVRYLGMNNKIAPFDNVKVRQAVMYAVPYDTILQKAVYGHGRPAKSIVPSDFPSSDQTYWPYNTDPAKAKQLLAEAGVSNLSTELDIRLSIPEDVESATWIQSALADVGITVTVNKMTDAEFFDKLNKHQLPMFIHDWYSWLPDAYYQFNWLATCGQATNYVDYCNPKLDELFKAGLYEQDQQKRSDISVQMQHMWLDDAPWAPLYHPNWIIGTSSKFTGFVKDFALMLQYAQMGKTQ